MGIALLAAGIATFLVMADRPAGQAVHLGSLWIDLVLMAVLAGVAGRADRYWPIYLAALHLLTIGVHGARMFDPTILPVVYDRAPAATAYPMIVILVAGTVRHRRRSALHGSAERDWSSFRW